MSRIFALLRFQTRLIVATALAGAVLGLFLSPWFGTAWRDFIQPWILALPGWPVVLASMLVGASLLSVLVLAGRWLWRGETGLAIDGATIEVPGLKIDLRIDRRQREAGWRIFAELATRIATQRLDAEESLIREALASLYETFKRIRDELGRTPPDRTDAAPAEAGLHTYALVILNRGLRPCLARWHPLLKAWELAGNDERDWPLRALCRQDLEATRQCVVDYARRLGEALGVPRADQLLLGDTDLLGPRLVDVSLIREREAADGLSGSAKAGAWRIHIELATRIATQPLGPNEGRLREALASVHALFAIVRDELKALGPAGQPIADIGLRILNDALRPFLATWLPRLHDWEQAHPDASERDWDGAADCRAALDALRGRLASETAALAARLGLDRASAASAVVEAGV